MKILTINKDDEIPEPEEEPFVIIPIGLPGGGKTFKKPENCYIVCKDDFRFSLLNYEKTGKDFDRNIEFIINEIEKMLIMDLTAERENLYIDECNLSQSRRKEIIDNICNNIDNNGEFSKNGHYIQYVFFSDFAAAIDNNRERERTVSDEVISRMVDEFEYLSEWENKNIDKMVIVK